MIFESRAVVRAATIAAISPIIESEHGSDLLRGIKIDPHLSGGLVLQASDNAISVIYHERSGISSGRSEVWRAAAWEQSLKTVLKARNNPNGDRIWMILESAPTDASLRYVAANSAQQAISADPIEAVNLKHDQLVTKRGKYPSYASLVMGEKPTDIPPVWISPNQFKKLMTVASALHKLDLSFLPNEPRIAFRPLIGRAIVAQVQGVENAMFLLANQRPSDEDPELPTWLSEFCAPDLVS